MKTINKHKNINSGGMSEKKPVQGIPLHLLVVPCRPILFSSSMVRAILGGRKTQTRRIVKAPEWWEGHLNYSKNNVQLTSRDGAEIFYCPRGNPGDRLWVRETWRKGLTGVFYKEDETQWSRSQDYKWTPSIFMPRWASRITLEIINVRVERVSEISEADAMAEGATPSIVGADLDHLRYRAGFQTLWDAINAKRGFAWDVNPWVWVIEFRRV